MICEGKRTFEFFDDAHRAAKRTREHGYGSTIQPYRCSYCSKIHIGHDTRTRGSKLKKFRFKNRRK